MRQVMSEDEMNSLGCFTCEDKDIIIQRLKQENEKLKTSIASFCKECFNEQIDALNVKLENAKSVIAQFIKSARPHPHLHPFMIAAQKRGIEYLKELGE